MDFAALQARIRDAARAAFAELVATNPGEELCAFALYSDDGAMTVCPAANTRAFVDELEDPAEEIVTAEWAFEGEGAEAAFDAICDDVRATVSAVPDGGFAAFKGALFETCLRALEELRGDALFDGVLLCFAVSDSAPRPASELARLNPGR